MQDIEPAAAPPPDPDALPDLEADDPTGESIRGGNLQQIQQTLN